MYLAAGAAINWACQHGQIDVVKVLLAAADPNAPERLDQLAEDSVGMSCVGSACYSKEKAIDVLRALLELGADVNRGTPPGTVACFSTRFS